MTARRVTRRVGFAQALCGSALLLGGLLAFGSAEVLADSYRNTAERRDIEQKGSKVRGVDVRGNPEDSVPD